MRWNWGRKLYRLKVWHRHFELLSVSTKTKILILLSILLLLLLLLLLNGLHRTLSLLVSKNRKFGVVICSRQDAQLYNSVLRLDLNL